MENIVALSIVMLGIALSLFISFYHRRSTSSTANFYVAGGGISPRVNGWAMLGDYASAASFLGVAGAVALMGVDGWWLALGFFAAWIVVLLLIASPLKNVGKYTVADLLNARFKGKEKGIRTIAMVSTLALCVMYLIPQIVGAGHLFGLLLGWSYLPTVMVTGTLMGVFVILGGMKGTSYNQAIQGAILFGALLFLLVFGIVSIFAGNPVGVITAANEMVPPLLAAANPEAVALTASMANAAPGEAITAVRELMPAAASAVTPGVGLRSLADNASLVIALFFGVLGLPHILIRFYTVSSAKEARKSAEITIWGLAIFYAAVFFVGLIAMYGLYPQLVALLAEGKRGVATNMTMPMLGDMMGGQVLLGVIAAGAMAAMLSTSAGLLISATTSLSHDLYKGILRPDSTDEQQLRFAKIGAGCLALIAIGMSVWLKDQNVAMLVGMCFGIAASTFAPALVFAVWWRKLTSQAVIIGMATGLVTSLLFTFARFFGVDSIIGLDVLINPALYSMPLAVVVTIVVSLMTNDCGELDEFMAKAHGK
ncbi:cation/acetate symporter [Glaciecola punicea ACAM 611]|jgi:cation/acetate symporter|uniref:Cation/acetate symporter n=1 Tax=Glaciecola punicea ACAM 611 TaxID=1121923 RepID=H5T8E0_9ALTE|nr:cation acetate symporter [Glaciecola punicea]OFA30537.1 cation acetate symporter [Glaciecola punicea]GAB54581.1 cation/acetate symporter [Glaciecola punicea ACAM 611]